MMNDNNATAPDPHISHFPVIRQIKTGSILNWLSLGLNDLRQGTFPSLFYGIIFAVAGLLMHTVLIQASWLLAGLTTGFLLLGPFLAMGLYDLSRRMEVGEKPQLIPTLTAWRKNLINVGLFAGVLVVVLLIWARASMVIFALFFQGGLPTFHDIVLSVMTLQQPMFTIVYFAIGGLFAAFIFSISVIAIPLMADKKTDAITAAIASISAVSKNTTPMLAWALCIVLLVAFGFATYFIGLIFTMPLVGHASWHAYRELVE